MDVADEVQIDRELTPPPRSESCYALQGHPQTGETRSLPTRRCDSQADLKKALVQEIALLPGSKVVLTDAQSTIGIRVLETPGYYTVVRCWVDRDGALHPAAWAQHRRTLFRQELATWLRAACPDVSFYRQTSSGQYEPTPVPEDEVDRAEIVIGPTLAAGRAYLTNLWK